MDSQARVLHVLETGGHGGAETVVLELAKRLPRERYCVEVAVGRAGWLSESLQSEGIRAHVIPRRRGFDLRMARETRGLIRQKNIRLVHAHMFRGGLMSSLAARAAGIPAVVTVHGPDDVMGSKRRAAVHVIGRLASRVITVSDYLRRLLISTCRVSPGRVQTIHNGVDFQRFEARRQSWRREIRAELGTSQGPNIGAVGGLRDVKGHEYLIRALPELMLSEPGVQLLLIGEGPSRGDLERMAQRLGLADRVHFLGFRSDVPRVLSALDCFVLPSLSEGLSIATIEAMAAGLPVVVTDSGGPSELVLDGESGLVVPPGDPRPLAQAVLAVLQDHDVARRLGAAARRRAAAFDLPVMVERYDTLYREVLSESS